MYQIWWRLAKNGFSRAITASRHGAAARLCAFSIDLTTMRHCAAFGIDLTAVQFGYCGAAPQWCFTSWHNLSSQKVTAYSGTPVIRPHEVPRQSGRFTEVVVLAYRLRTDSYQMLAVCCFWRRKSLVTLSLRLTNNTERETEKNSTVCINQLIN